MNITIFNIKKCKQTIFSQKTIGKFYARNVYHKQARKRTDIWKAWLLSSCKNSPWTLTYVESPGWRQEKRKKKKPATAVGSSVKRFFLSHPLRLLRKLKISACACQSEQRSDLTKIVLILLNDGTRTMIQYIQHSHGPTAISNSIHNSKFYSIHKLNHWINALIFCMAGYILQVTFCTSHNTPAKTAMPYSTSAVAQCTQLVN